jgi:hypothetical protein
VKTRCLVCMMLVCVFALPIVARGDAISVLETKVKTVAAFKNGLAFVFRSGKATLADGWVDMNELPPAALGTMWIGTTNPLERVEEVVSYKRTDENAKDVQSLAELVDLNVGKTIGLTYYCGGSREPTGVTGKVLSSAGQVVVIQPTGTEGKRAIKKDAIQTVELTSDNAVKGKDVSNRAKARIGGKPKSAEITMAYLEKGITWSPSYLVNIRDAKTADITLEAVLANDTEDLEDAEVSFVVGYPNFQFADITNPMSLQQTVAAFVQALTTGRSENRYAGTARVMAQSVAYNYAAYDTTAGVSSWQPELAYSATQPMAGESNEDLYLYSQPHVTLKKGDRARYTVFTGKVPYEHAYELDVPDTMNIDYYGNRTSDQDKDNEPQVWHVLKLENTTQYPWTTAPALAINGPLPVAQDTLKYTPPKGKNTLKLTIATDIRATQEQTEASREQVSMLRRDYDKVTVDGKLTVRNFKPKSVKLTVRKAIVGEVAEASDSGKIVKLAKKLNSVNPDSQVTWEFELAPGAEKVLTYQYKVLVYR